MIFVTVGNMDPFDRLIVAVDEWAARHRGDVELFAQIGAGAYRPRFCRHVPFLKPDEYRQVFEKASIVVSHAGMGTIITALELRKTLIIMPKRAALGEQRNEHQLATVKHFQKSQRIRAAESESDLPNILDQTIAKGGGGELFEFHSSQWPADPGLISFVHDFVM